MLLSRLGRTACTTRYLVLPPKLMMVPFYTVHVSQVLGWLPRNIKHMKNVIGPDTRLWVFVKEKHGKVKLYGPFFAIGSPGINLIEDGLLGQFTAQVYCHFHGLSIFPKKMTPSPGHLIYYCPYTCRCIGRCGTTA